MTWNTSNGDRVLAGAEGDLVREVLNLMVDELSEYVDGSNEDLEFVVGVDAFDALTNSAKIATLRWVAEYLLMETAETLDLTAASEAAVYAIYRTLYLAIQLEIELEDEMPEDDQQACCYWRSMALRAYQETLLEEFDGEAFGEAELSEEMLDGEPLSGEALEEEALSGGLSGECLSGECLSGECLSGECLSGECLSGECLSGGCLSGEELGRTALGEEIMGEDELDEDGFAEEDSEEDLDERFAEPGYEQSKDLENWNLVIESLADCVLWDRDFEMNHLFLDEAPELARLQKRYLGIADDYYTVVAPDIRPEQLETTLESLRSLLRRKPR